MNTFQNRRIPLQIRIAVQLLFIAATFSIFFTIYYLVVNSFKTEQAFALSQYTPALPDFTNYYRVLFETSVGKAFINSIGYASISTALAIILGSLAAYPFATMNFRGSKTIFKLVIATMYMAPMTLVIPMYIQMIQIGLNNKFMGLTLLYAGTRLAFAIFLMTTFFRSISKELSEAASIDGCSSFMKLFLIYVPLSKPAVATLAVVSFAAVWNDLLYGLIFIQSQQLKPIMLVIAFFKGGRELSSYTCLFASITISIIPVVLIYMFCQRYFEKGMIMGSIK